MVWMESACLILQATAVSNEASERTAGEPERSGEHAHEETCAIKTIRKVDEEKILNNPRKPRKTYDSNEHLRIFAKALGQPKATR